MSKSSKKARLDSRIVNSVLSSWSDKASEDPQAVRRSLDILLSLPLWRVHPTPYSFDIVLKALKSGASESRTTDARMDEVVALLDNEFRNGTLGCKLEYYLKKRQAWMRLQ